MVTDDANMWFKLNHDIWFNYALMQFQASANARCPEPQPLQGALKLAGMYARHESDRQSEKIRQTDRERIRQTERIRDSQPDQIDRQRIGQTDRQTRENQTDRDRQTHRESDRHRNR